MKMNRLNAQYTKISYCEDEDESKFVNVAPFDDAVAAIRERILDIEKDNQRLEKENKELLDEHYKDNLVADLKKELDEVKSALRSGFNITPKEAEEINKWKNNHYTNQHNAPDITTRVKMSGAIGGSYLYEFTPTSIGDFGECICGNCRRRAFTESKGNKKEYEKLLKEYDAIFTFSQP